MQARLRQQESRLDGAMRAIDSARARNDVALQNKLDELASRYEREMVQYRDRQAWRENVERRLPGENVARRPKASRAGAPTTAAAPAVLLEMRQSVHELREEVRELRGLVRQLDRIVRERGSKN